MVVQALHGRAGRWLVNEKGMIASAGRLPDVPAGLRPPGAGTARRVGRSPAELAATLHAARELVTEALG